MTTSVHSSPTLPPTDLAGQIDRRAGKYLTFLLGREEYGIQVLQVREIMGLQEITELPQAPAGIRGVINLRGKVTPVISLRSKFGLPWSEPTARTCIVVVQVEVPAGAPGAPVRSAPLVMGLMVDAVSEVLNISTADIEDTPDLGVGATSRYVLGLAKINGKVKILLDIAEVLVSRETLHFDLPAEE